MKKSKKNQYSKKIKIEPAYQTFKKKCTRCKVSYMGNKYQRWCKNCRIAVSNNVWEEY